MGAAVKLSDELVATAKVQAKALHRSTAGQIEHWAQIGRIAEDNPDLPYQFARDLLIGLAEVQAGEVEPYIFGERE